MLVDKTELSFDSLHHHQCNFSVPAHQGWRSLGLESLVLSDRRRRNLAAILSRSLIDALFLTVQRSPAFSNKYRQKLGTCIRFGWNHLTSLPDGSPFRPSTSSQVWHGDSWPILQLHVHWSAGLHY
eukprot:754022-Hanusia_phi.AAC.1